MALLGRFRLLILFAVIALGLLQGAPSGAQVHLQEKEIKAGLLYNFLKYTEWPESKMGQGAIVVCLYGGDPFDGYLDSAKGRTVQQRPIVVSKIRSAGQAGNCNMLFVDESARGEWPQLSSSLNGKGVLTVSDFGGFTDAGGMIEFSRKGERINVLLNSDAVSDAQLHVNDRMLRLVTVVHPGKKGGGKP